MQPSSAPPKGRPDLRLGFEEFNLEMSRRGFIGARVLPVAEVAEQYGSFGVLPIEQALKDVDDLRASGAAYGVSDLKFQIQNYATQDRGHVVQVDRRNAKIYGSYFRAEQIAARIALDVVMRNYEKRVAAAIFNTTTWAGSLKTAVGTEWSTVASATVIADVAAARKKVRDQCGMIATHLIVSWPVFENMKRNAGIIDQVKYNGLMDPRVGAISEQALATVLGVQQILVGGAIKNTANESAAAPTLADVWDDEFAMVAYIDESGNLDQPTVGRTVHWGEDGSTFGGTIEEFSSEERRGDFKRCRAEVQELIIYPQCGHLLENISA